MAGLRRRSAHKLLKSASLALQDKLTMPTLVLKNGVAFGYTDTGALPGGQEYTTLVIIHGHTYHSGKFRLTGSSD